MIQVKKNVCTQGVQILVTPQKPGSTERSLCSAYLHRTASCAQIPIQCPHHLHPGRLVCGLPPGQAPRTQLLRDACQIGDEEDTERCNTPSYPGPIARQTLPGALSHCSQLPPCPSLPCVTASKSRGELALRGTCTWRFQGEETKLLRISLSPPHPRGQKRRGKEPLSALSFH